MIWNKARECESIEKRKERQLADLKELCFRVYERVPFYRKKFDNAGINPSDIKTLDDIAKIPFTTKDEMRETYPYGLLAVDETDIVEIHTSSGTTGTPVVDAYTQSDMDMWGEVMARCFGMAGGDKGDVVQNAYGYGMFTGGLGVHYGSQKIGANIIPAASGNTKRQLMLMRDFKSTILTCTPSYALFMADEARDMGIEFKDLHLKSGIFGAEPWSDNMRDEIESKLHLKAHDIYGLTEIIGPGVSCECDIQHGLHVNEDYFFPEIIDPETGKVLPEGEKGELVFTTLTKQGTPILRYRTRDITWLWHDECKCGRTLVKMHRLLGRNDDMLIIRGVNVFPSQIENVLLRVEETQPHYQIIIERGSTHLDEVELQVEVEESFFSDETKELERIKNKLHQELKQELGISINIRLVEPKSIERSIGKAKRVIDKRNI
ncbi:MAG: phenylacetate--CoA ligase [Spirochaetes bacterium]|nr:phenylacetate--CoA ligase [Spirochaetota bacterium]